MSIGYGGQGGSLTYQTSATFQFAHPANTDFLFGFESQGSLGTGFDSAMLDVFVNSVLAYQRSFTTLADAQAFFTDNPVDIGFGPGGPATVELVYDLTASQISSGFQFDYAFRVGYSLGCPWPCRRCGTAGSDLGERWSSRLVATTAEDRLIAISRPTCASRDGGHACAVERAAADFQNRVGRDAKPRSDLAHALARPQGVTNAPLKLRRDRRSAKLFALFYGPF
jgi:hypothetical protein